MDGCMDGCIDGCMDGGMHACMCVNHEQVPENSTPVRIVHSCTRLVQVHGYGHQKQKSRSICSDALSTTLTDVKVLALSCSGAASASCCTCCTTASGSAHSIITLVLGFSASSAAKVRAVKPCGHRSTSGFHSGTLPNEDGVEVADKDITAP